MPEVKLNADQFDSTTQYTAQASLMLCRALGYFNEKGPETQVISQDWGKGSLMTMTKDTKLKDIFSDLGKPGKIDSVTCPQNDQTLAKDNKGG